MGDLYVRQTMAGWECVLPYEWSLQPGSLVFPTEAEAEAAMSGAHTVAMAYSSSAGTPAGDDEVWLEGWHAGVEAGRNEARAVAS